MAVSRLAWLVGAAAAAVVLFLGFEALAWQAGRRWHVPDYPRAADPLPRQGWDFGLARELGREADQALEPDWSDDQLLADWVAQWEADHAGA